MTQIRKAFESAVKDAALRNFRTTFRKALNETAEENFNKELNKLAFPILSSKTVSSLQPEVYLQRFADCVDAIIEQMFCNACRTAKVQAYNALLGNVCSKALKDMRSEDFRAVEDEVIIDFLNQKGTPASIVVTMIHLLEDFFAKEVFERLVKARQETPDAPFADCIERFTHDAAKNALLAVMEYTPANSAGQYKAHIMPYVVKELNLIRVRQGDNIVFNDACKHVFHAFIRS